jgi:hypothetical protein
MDENEYVENSIDESKLDETPKAKKNNKLVYLFISVIAAARIAHGFFISITGPTLKGFLM